MKKKYVALLLLPALLVGCGKKDANQKPIEKEQEITESSSSMGTNDSKDIKDVKTDDIKTKEEDDMSIINENENNEEIETEDDTSEDVETSNNK